MLNLIKRLVAILQIAGGTFGLVPMAESVSGHGSALALITALIGLVFLVMAIVSGVLLLEGGSGSVRLARWVQLLQVPIINTHWFSYYTQLGAALPLAIALRMPIAPHTAALFPVWNFTLTPAGPEIGMIGLNLLALLLWWLLRFSR